MSWLIWAIGAVVLLGAGFATAYVPWWRARDLRRRTAWSTARAAIESASVSRDASAKRVEEAEELLAKAESIAADRGGESAADIAANYARRADRLWREAARG